MADDKTLKILIKTEGDTRGLDEVKGKLGEVEQQAQQAGQGFSELDSLIGLGLGVGAVAAVTAITDAMVAWADEERRIATDILDVTQKLNNQETAWFNLAANASSFFDVVRLGMQMLPQVQQFATALEAAQNRQIGLMQRAVDFAARSINAGPLMGAPGLGPYEGQKERETTELQELLNRALLESVSAFQRGKDAAAEWAQIQAGPVSLAIAAVKSNITDLNAQIAKLQPTVSAEDNKRFFELNQQLATQEKHLQQLEKDQAKLNDAEEKGGSVRASNTLLLREQATILQDIRQQEQLIQAAPFMGIDEKHAALLQLYRQEIGLIALQIQATKAAMQNSALDPAQLEQLRQKLQQLTFESDHLGLKVVGEQRPLSAEMVNWANSFGTASQQIGQSLQQGIGTSLQSLNQMLITGKFNAQQLVGSLANIALQLIENLAIQQIMQAFASGAKAKQKADSASALAVEAPLAAATSVSSWGAAAIGGAIAIGVIAAIMAALTLHSGGQITRRGVRRMHSGGLADDEIPIIAQEGEIMIQRSVAQQPGMAEFLLGLNSGMFMHTGGGVGGAGVGGFFGTWPSGGSPFGPTMIPTYWSATYPGVPMGVPLGGWPGGSTTSGMGYDYGGGYSGLGSLGFTSVGRGYYGGPSNPFARPALTGYLPSNPAQGAHTGGLLTRSRFPRFHGGGSIGGGGGGGNVLGGRGGGDVHIFAFTDMKQLSKAFANSTANRKAVFDTVRGRRIDLGL